MKKYWLWLGCCLLVPAISGCDYNTGNDDEQEITASDIKQMNQGKGIGAIDRVPLHEPLEAERVSRGFAIYEMRCQSCHALDTSRLVGPGWEGVTQRHKPEWIMNMILNVDMMLENDPAAQQLLQDHRTRMPDPGLSIGDARDLLEFMRSLDKTS